MQHCQATVYSKLPLSKLPLMHRGWLTRWNSVRLPGRLVIRFGAMGAPGLLRGLFWTSMLLRLHNTFCYEHQEAGSGMTSTGVED